MEKMKISRKKQFQELWNQINHKYACTVYFDGDELIGKAIAHIDNELFVSKVQYTTTSASQKDKISEYEIARGDSFGKVTTSTQTLKRSLTSNVKYDLIGKIAKGTTLIRKDIAEILKGIREDKLLMFRNNPEEFITKVIRLINEQKRLDIMMWIIMISC